MAIVHADGILPHARFVFNLFNSRRAQIITMHRQHPRDGDGFLLLAHTAFGGPDSPGGACCTALCQVITRVVVLTRHAAVGRCIATVMPTVLHGLSAELVFMASLDVSSTRTMTHNDFGKTVRGVQSHLTVVEGLPLPMMQYLARHPTENPGEPFVAAAACAAPLASTAPDVEEDQDGFHVSFAPAMAMTDFPMLGRGRSNSVVNFSSLIPAPSLDKTVRNQHGGAEGDAPSRLRPASEIFPYSAHGQALAATEAALKTWLHIEDRPHEMSTVIHLGRFPAGSIAVFRTRLRAQPSQALQSLRSLLELSTFTNARKKANAMAA